MNNMTPKTKGVISRLHENSFASDFKAILSDPEVKKHFSNVQNTVEEMKNDAAEFAKIQKKKCMNITHDITENLLE